MARPLKVIAAEALARAALFLDADAPRCEFEEYAADPEWRDAAHAFRWIETVTETGVYATADEAVAAIADMCVGMEPRYPWGDLRDATLLVWDAWCFCVARWARENDMETVYRLPMSGPLDHRHAYATTGPSCNDAAKLLAFIDATRGLVPGDWLEMLVDPVMWHRSAFTLWALRAGGSARLRVRMLNDALAVAARCGNREAVRAVCCVADEDAELNSRFWNIVEISKTYKLVIDSLL